MDLHDLQPFLNQLPGLAAATGITVAGRKAIARLVTGVSDLAMIPIDSVLGTAKDKRESRSIVSKAMADAVAKSISSDPELVERAAIAQLGEAARKQQAREKVAEAAINELLKPKDAKEEKFSENSNEYIDEDWMNVFVGYAEKASSERLQQMWGRVLAGQIEKSNNFSIATLRTISELPSREAKNFEVIAKHSVGSCAQKENGLNLEQLVDLEACGLIVATTSGLSTHWPPSETLSLTMRGDNYSICTKGPESGSLEITKLTPAGHQCAQLVSDRNEHENAIAMARQMKKTSPSNEFHVGIIQPGNLFKTITIV